MGTARWRIDEIFADALELPAGRRAAFLAEACGGDEELRREVESLLSDHGDGGFLVTGGAEESTRLLAASVGDSLVGTQLDRFAVTAKLGAGGMGEVYLAHDPKLDRRVALKLLPAHLASDPETLRRFRREALAVSALNHPNILTVYEIVEAAGKEVLVSELVEGVTLRQRLRQGSLPLPRAIDLAIQVARGLEAAHRVGIVHRDVKPENLMIRDDGLVKLLDFGIAKSRPRSSEGTELSQSQTHFLTGTGVIVGTASYMSPEQARGEPAGRQADLWALGCVLYEVLTGRQAFPGRTATDVLAAILTRDPPWEALPADTPSPVRNLLRRCLEKDPETRLQSAAEAVQTLRRLEDPAASGSSDVTTVTAAPASRRRRQRLPAWERVAWAAALAIAAFVVGWMRWRDRDLIRGPSHLALPTPQASSRGEWFQLSPRGDQIAWIGWSREGTSSLWVRRLRELEERQLSGTEGAIQPFWSPDGRWVGFFAGGKLQKVPAAGGPPEVLAVAATPYGGAWSRRGVIVFAPDLVGGLSRVSADGGAVAPLTKVAPEEEAHRWPCFLPDGEHFAFLADSPRTEHHQIRLGSLAGGPSSRLVQAVSQPACAGGSLLYVRSGTLLAHRLSARTARLEGEPTPLAKDLSENYWNHHFELTALPGLLAYRSADPAMQFVWIDRRGRTLETVGEPGRYGAFKLSRDERRLAFARYDADGRIAGVWWHDLARGIVARVATSGDWGVVGYPVWSPDGERLAVGVATAGPWSPRLVRIGDPAPPRPLLKTTVDDLPSSWSPDGRFLAFIRSQPQADDNDIWVASLDDGSVAQLTHEDGNEIHPAFSPDGRWIAYGANPSGRREVYLRRFPEGTPAIQVSRSGGGLPAWRGDSRELYFVSRDHELVAVPLAGGGGELVPGEPEVLFSLDAGDRPRVWWEGVAPARDGSRFLALEHVANPARQPLHLLVGWWPR